MILCTSTASMNRERDQKWPSRLGLISSLLNLTLQSKLNFSYRFGPYRFNFGLVSTKFWMLQSTSHYFYTLTEKKLTSKSNLFYIYRIKIQIWHFLFCINVIKSSIQQNSLNRSWTIVFHVLVTWPIKEPKIKWIKLFLKTTAMMKIFYFVFRS